MGHSDFKYGMQEKRKWRLWVVFTPGSFLYRKLGANYTYYNYPPDTETSKHKLIDKCFKRRESDIEVAILYDNRTKKELERLK